MWYFTSLGAYLLVPFAVFWFLQRMLTSYLRSQSAEGLGCQRAPVRINKRLWGIDHVARLLNADRKGQVPTEYLKIYKEQKDYTYEQTILGTKQIMTIDPPNIQAMLATQFQDFEIGPIRRDNFAPLLGSGIFTADGKFWEHSRALLRPQFARAQIADLELEETHFKLMIQSLITGTSGWTQVVDLKPLFFRFTIDTATELLFGTSVHSQTNGSSANSDLHSIVDAFDRCTAVLGIRTRLSGLYWLYNPKRFQEDVHKIHKFVDHFVHAALQHKRSLGNEKPKGTYVFLYALVESITDPVQVRNQLLHLLLAGRDTTAGLLGWALWSLSRNPKVYRKLRATIIATFGTYKQPRDITFESLKSCMYLQHTLKETLRLFPPVPLNTRQAARDTTLPKGGGPDGLCSVFVKQGTEIGYSVYAMHRRKDIWGDDAEIFNPDRWADRKPGWDYLPFNGGPRICLRQQFALTEAGYVLTRLLQRFDEVENCDPEMEPVHSYNLTSAPNHVLVKFHEGRT
ncbi:cytochrome p450 [Colletotrichum incanum]|uniref:Cytochrome p450 n=1 Tax=Colletotrichum incanum TaxID=1573173 RepID=A0A167AZR8_COLIC|nr:cytochrome p450 [Colletotrichum incanum]OHW99903.1 cytochrome p450 family protein [Colletotrichum incanum]